MSVALQWSPDDYRIGARCSNFQLRNIINSLCVKSLINKIGLLGCMGGGGGGACEHTCCTPLPMDLLQLKIYNIEPNFSYLQVCLKTHRVLDLHWKLSVIKVEQTLHETGSVLILI